MIKSGNQRITSISFTQSIIFKLRGERKTKPKKVKINLNDWLNIANKCIGNHKKDLNILNRLLKNLTKKDKKDYEKEICKEIIQRLDQKKTLPEESQQIALQISFS